MLENWLKPINPNDFIDLEQLSDYQWGSQILINEQSVDSLEGIKIAIIGIDEDSANAIRPHLYAMSSLQQALPVADLGNIQKIHPEVIIPLLQELQSGGIIPIIIGRYHAYTYAQYMAYQQFNMLVNAVLVGERIPYTFDERKTEKDYFYLNQIFDQKDHYLFNISQIGFQSHYVDKRILDLFDDKGFEYLRLGLVKSDLHSVEPVIRDADMLSFDISVIRQSDAPGQQLPSPSGVFSEEASQVAYFAGMSDKLSSVGFYGLHPENDVNGKTAQLVAQMIWYFTDGFCSRTQDLPIEEERFMKYQVSFKNGTYDMVFWKSRISERWWLQLPSTGNQRQERHRLVPCTHADYKQACLDEVPDRFLTAFKRFF